MKSVKKFYLALVLALTHLLRLEEINSIDKINLNGRNHFFCLRTTELPLEVDQKTGEPKIKNKTVWITAYLDLKALKIVCEEDKPKLIISKNSLKVMILKKLESFDKDVQADPVGFCKRVQNGELIGAFEISQDLVSYKENVNAFTFIKCSNVHWTHQLNLAGFDYSWNHRLTGGGGGIHASEDKQPVIKDITIEFLGFKTDTNDSTKIKIGDNTELLLSFTIKRKESEIEKKVYLPMSARSEDERLLLALEAQWDKGKKYNNKNKQTHQLFAVSPVVSNQDMNGGGDNSTDLLNQDGVQQVAAASSKLNQVENSQAPIHYQADSKDDQSFNSEPNDVQNTLSNEAIEKVFTQNQKSSIGSASVKSVGGISQDQKPALKTYQPANSKSLRTNKTEAKFEGGLKENTGSKGEEEQTDNKKPKGGAFNSNIEAKVEDGKQEKNSDKVNQRDKNPTGSASKSNPKTKLEGGNQKNNADKVQQSDNKPTRIASKEEDKSWWKNPSIYSAIIVIFVFALGLVAYAFHKRETIDKEDR